MIHYLQLLGKYFYKGVDCVGNPLMSYWRFLEIHIPYLGTFIALILFLLSVVVGVLILLGVSRMIAESYVDDCHFVEAQSTTVSGTIRKVCLYVIYAYFIRMLLRLVLNWFCEIGTIDGITALIVAVPYVCTVFYWTVNYFSAYTAKGIFKYWKQFLVTQLVLLVAFLTGFICFAFLTTTFIFGLIFLVVVILAIAVAIFGQDGGNSGEKKWIVVLVPWG